MGPLEEAYELLEVQRESDDLSAKDDESVGSLECFWCLATTTRWDMMLRQVRRLKPIVLSL